jgi:uncharacterized protein (DUF2062 family)
MTLKRNRRFYRLFASTRSPHFIASGMALGLFIGMTPFFGLHVVAALILATFLKMSKIAAVIGVNITNAFTAPLIYPLNYWVGTRLVGSSHAVDWPAAFSVSEMLNFLRYSPLIVRDMVIGGTVLGLPLAFLGYGLILWGVKRYRGGRISAGIKNKFGIWNLDGKAFPAQQMGDDDTADKTGRKIGCQGDTQNQGSHK